ncbi:MAG: heterodisulfide reductase-related iron-sulfur binding cluster [Candidatus Hermodarchaeota archaeon]
MVSINRVSTFKDDLCDLCGECLHQCPVLQLPLDVAREEIKRLIEGTKSEFALSKCNTCFSCNFYCPQNANPYQLILERWNDLYKKRGAPPLYKFVCPTETPNIWQLLNIFLSKQERIWINNWMNYRPKPEDNLLIIGNYTHLFPFIIGGSKLLEYFKPVDLIDHWEGGAYLYQGGYLDLVQKIAKKCNADFETWGVLNIAHTLDAVQYIFSEVHQKEMKVDHNRNFINFNEWILSSLETGKILIPNKLDITVTIHDNCYSKASEGKYWDPPRKILELCGCGIKEMEHIRKDSLCCGFGAGASWVKNFSIPFDIISEGHKKFKEAEATGADALISYCGGCIYLLWATRELIGSKVDIFHIIEIVRMAMGEQLQYPDVHIERAWDIIAIITYQLIISILQKNFFIKRISYDKTKSTFIPKRHLLLRTIRTLFKIHFIKKIFRKLFLLMMTILKTR